MQDSEENFRTFFETMTDLAFVISPEGRILLANQTAERKLGYSAAELAQMHILDVHSAHNHQEAEEIFTAFIRGERETCLLPLARKDGGLIPVETKTWAGIWNGADCIFGISKDLSAEQEAQQRFEQLFRRNPALMALTTLTEQRFVDVNDAFLKVLAYERAEIIGKTANELGLLTRPEQQAVIEGKLKVEGRIDDFELQLRCNNGTILDGLFSSQIIRWQGQTFCLSVLIDITERKQIRASQIKLATKKHQLEKTKVLSLVANAIAEERLRISQEIHDGVAQNLASLRMKAGLMHDWAEQDLPRLHSELDAWQEQLRQNIHEVRRAIFALRPIAIDEMGFYLALHQFATDFGGQNELQINLNLNGPADGLPELLEPVLFRLIQEALNNVAKHANATTVWIELQVHPGQSMSLSIRDNGIGFNPDRLRLSSRFNHLGLTQMRERVALLEGEVEISSKPGQGTMLQINLPLPEQSEEL